MDAFYTEWPTNEPGHVRLLLIVIIIIKTVGCDSTPATAKGKAEADQHTGREAHAQAHRPPPSSAGHLLEGPSSSSICLICTASSTSHADISLA